MDTFDVSNTLDDANFFYNPAHAFFYVGHEDSIRWSLIHAQFHALYVRIDY